MDNRRTLISLWNLCDLLERYITHPQAAGETFLAADGEDLSTSELMRHLARGLNRPARLCGSLQVDCGKARQILGWTPPVSVGKGLERTAQGYRLGRVGK